MIQTEAAQTVIISVHFAPEDALVAELNTLLQTLHDDIVVVDKVQTQTHHTLFLNVPDEQAAVIINKINSLEGVGAAALDTTFSHHIGGKIEVISTMAIKGREDLSMAYTPEVAKVCTAIEHNPEQADTFTMRQNAVAIISDGTAVLGLGDIGPKAALPVMEGKALLFKEFANINAFPLCLATKDIDEIIRTVTYLAPNFGGINLEDISAPRCFAIEEQLKKIMDIPVFHDDQHGTAIVVLAGLINALKLVKKNHQEVKVVINGAGAAGVAITKLLIYYGVKNIIVLDSVGAICAERDNLNNIKAEISQLTNPNDLQGGLENVIEGADVFIGVSVANLLKPEWLHLMKKQPIIFAMANPVPEIDPKLALESGAAVVATGRSDYPNQINNVLAFPGVFRGALDNQIKQITDQHKLAAAIALAGIIPDDQLTADNIIVDAFNSEVVKVISSIFKS